jgi:hypothetical protein
MRPWHYSVAAVLAVGAFPVAASAGGTGGHDDQGDCHSRPHGHYATVDVARGSAHFKKPHGGHGGHGDKDRGEKCKSPHKPPPHKPPKPYPTPTPTPSPYPTPTPSPYPTPTSTPTPSPTPTETPTPPPPPPPPPVLPPPPPPVLPTPTPSGPVGPSGGPVGPSGHPGTPKKRVVTHAKTHFFNHDPRATAAQAACLTITVQRPGITHGLETWKGHGHCGTTRWSTSRWYIGKSLRWSKSKQRFVGGKLVTKHKAHFRVFTWSHGSVLRSYLFDPAYWTHPAAYGDYDIGLVVTQRR